MKPSTKFFVLEYVTDTRAHIQMIYSLFSGPGFGKRGVMEKTPTDWQAGYRRRAPSAPQEHGHQRVLSHGEKSEPRLLVILYLKHTHPARRSTPPARRVLRRA